MNRASLVIRLCLTIVWPAAPQPVADSNR